MQYFYTVREKESGNILPLAGIWKFDKYGKQSADRFVLGDDEIEVVAVQVEATSVIHND